MAVANVLEAKVNCLKFCCILYINHAYLYVETMFFPVDIISESLSVSAKKIFLMVFFKPKNYRLMYVQTPAHQPMEGVKGKEWFHTT